MKYKTRSGSPKITRKDIGQQHPSSRSRSPFDDGYQVDVPFGLRTREGIYRPGQWLLDTDDDDMNEIDEFDEIALEMENEIADMFDEEDYY